MLDISIYSYADRRKDLRYPETRLLRENLRLIREIGGKLTWDIAENRFERNLAECYTSLSTASTRVISAARIPSQLLENEIVKRGIFKLGIVDLQQSFRPCFDTVAEICFSFQISRKTALSPSMFRGYNARIAECQRATPP